MEVQLDVVEPLLAVFLEEALEILLFLAVGVVALLRLLPPLILGIIEIHMFLIQKMLLCQIRQQDVLVMKAQQNVIQNGIDRGVFVTLAI